MSKLNYSDHHKVVAVEVPQDLDAVVQPVSAKKLPSRMAFHKSEEDQERLQSKWENRIENRQMSARVGALKHETKVELDLEVSRIKRMQLARWIESLSDDCLLDFTVRQNQFNENEVTLTVKMKYYESR